MYETNEQNEHGCKRHEVEEITLIFAFFRVVFLNFSYPVVAFYNIKVFKAFYIRLIAFFGIIEYSRLATNIFLCESLN